MDPMSMVPPTEQGADRLDDRLRALASRAAWPEAPDVVAGAVGRLGARGPERCRRESGGRLSAGRGRLVVVLVLLALLLAAAVGSAALLGLPGLRIGVTDQPPSPAVPTDAAAVRVSLGTPADLEVARATLGEGLLVPALGESPEVLVAGAGRRPRVALVYPVAAGAPALLGDIGLIVTQWAGALEEPYARKWLTEDEGHAEAVVVQGVRGYWVSGMPHVLEYLDDLGGIRRPSSRLVGDVLVWQAGPVVYRIETPLGLAATLEIAESMSPLAPAQPSRPSSDRVPSGLDRVVARWRD